MFTFVGIEEGMKYVEKAMLKYKEIINSVDELCRTLRELKEIKVCCICLVCFGLF